MILCKVKENEEVQCPVPCQISIRFHFITLFLLIMFRHVVLLLMLSGLLPESQQGEDVLVESEEGKRYLAKKRQKNIDEDVGRDYSGLQGDFID